MQHYLGIIYHYICKLHKRCFVKQPKIRLARNCIYNRVQSHNESLGTSAAALQAMSRVTLSHDAPAKLEDGLLWRICRVAWQLMVARWWCYCRTLQHP